jgi:EF hand
LRRCGEIAVIGAAAMLATPASAELSAVDREAIEAAFARADTNGDGKLSREEAQRFPEIAARFDELDRDRDGFLSLIEFSVGATPPVKQ